MWTPALGRFLRERMKKLYCLLVTAFLTLTVFAEDGYKCNPTYEVYRETCYYQMTNGKYITRDTDSVIKKGAEISGQTSYWYLKDPKASNRLSPYIDPYDLKIKGSDVFDDYVLSSFDWRNKSSRWIPAWYMEAIIQKNREVIAMAEPGRLIQDNDFLSVDVPWYDYYKTAAYIQITNTGFYFNTPLISINGFAFEKLKKVNGYTYIAKVYPMEGESNERISWIPYAENLPELKDGKSFEVRFEINGSSMKIYNNKTNKILFDLIQLPFDLANDALNFFIETNAIVETLTVPDEYTNRREEDKFKLDRSLAKNKFMLVKENLKLRNEEKASSDLITVMATGSWVKILAIGKKETINGITSNWVKVSTVRNSVDADGNKVPSDTIGWCYGGYLE